MATFTREELLAALNALSDELAGEHILARIRIVGGAAITLAHDPDRGATRDVDCLSAHPSEAVLAAARRGANATAGLSIG